MKTKDKAILFPEKKVKRKTNKSPNKKRLESILFFQEDNTKNKVPNSKKVDPLLVFSEYSLQPLSIRTNSNKSKATEKK